MFISILCFVTPRLALISQSCPWSLRSCNGLAFPSATAWWRERNNKILIWGSVHTAHRNMYNWRRFHSALLLNAAAIKEVVVPSQCFHVFASCRKVCFLLVWACVQKTCVCVFERERDKACALSPLPFLLPSPLFSRSLVVVPPGPLSQ